MNITFLFSAGARRSVLVVVLSLSSSAPPTLFMMAAMATLRWKSLGLGFTVMGEGEEGVVGEGDELASGEDISGVNNTCN